jgi:hypothetical protein
MLGETLPARTQSADQPWLEAHTSFTWPGRPEKGKRLCIDADVHADFRQDPVGRGFHPLELFLLGRRKRESCA